jgi:hypothetical protein
MVHFAMKGTGMQQLKINLEGMGDFCARSARSPAMTSKIDPEMEFEAELAAALAETGVVCESESTGAATPEIV